MHTAYEFVYPVVVRVVCGFVSFFCVYVAAICACLSHQKVHSDFRVCVCLCHDCVIIALEVI